MTKNIEWLKKEIEEVLYSAHLRGEHTAMQSNAMYDEIVNKIDQLDEPETVEQTTRLLENVLKENKRLGKLLEEKHEEWFELMDEINNQETLSEYWIEQKSIDTHVDTVNGEIQVTFILDDLKELLVPKQELPVIPKFVADYIDGRKEVGFPIYQAIRIVRENSRFEHSHLREWLWTNKGQEIFVRAWLDGYTVEEEQKYYTKVKGWGVNGNDGHAYYSGKFPLSLTTSTESVTHTKDEWRNYGVYEDNADFVKVEEMEG